jgi:hypothetical protein
MDLMEMLALVLLVLVGAGLAYFAFRHKPERRAVAEFARPDIERDFRRLFAMTSQQGKEALIRRWMERTGCNRTEAMRLAAEEWRRDNR